MANINIEAVAVPRERDAANPLGGYAAAVVIGDETLITDHVLTFSTPEEAEKRAEWLFTYHLMELIRNQ